MTSGSGAPPLPPPLPPAVAARAVCDVAQGVVEAWAQPMDPAEHNRALSQLYSVLRDLGIATRGLARFQTAGHPADPSSPDFPRLIAASGEQLLRACRSLDGVLAAEGFGPVPDPDEPGAVLCQAARNAITAWRQPTGTSAERDAAVELLIAAIGYLAVATQSLSTWAPRQLTIQLRAVGTILNQVVACLSQVTAPPQVGTR